MTPAKRPNALIGLDIGGVNAHASVIGISEGNYRLFGRASAPTSLGEGLHIGAGVGQALENLQAQTGHILLKDSGGLWMPTDQIGRGVDRIGMVISAGPRLRTALVGLSALGSLKAGRALIDSLPLHLVGCFDGSYLLNEPRAIEALIRAQPELLVITGGEDSGATESIQRWIDIVRTACLLLPAAAQPALLYAGNPATASFAERRLEPITRLQIAANLQPLCGEYDLLPAQRWLAQEIMRADAQALPGLEEMMTLSEGLHGLTAPANERMVRFLSLSKAAHSNPDSGTGVLAVDLGGTYSMLSAGLNGDGGTVLLDKFPDLNDAARLAAARAIHLWSHEAVTLEEADEFICNYALLPGWVPDTRRALSLSMAFARYRLQQAFIRFSANHPWLRFHPDWGLLGHFEPVIASGAYLTQSPDPGAVMLTLLNGLQPHQITTLVLDQQHVLPLLGKLGELEPVLPVQLLSSPAFENLGTVISVTGRLPQGHTALSVHVETSKGQHFSADIQQGTLRRLAIPAGEAAVLELVPHRSVEIGFGGRGRGGRLKVVGGTLGAVIDARGRPLQLPEKTEPRIDLLKKWQQMMQGDHV